MYCLFQKKRKKIGSRTSKQTERPRLHTNSIVNLSKKLKHKDSEINCLKQKLWWGYSRRARTSSRLKPNVLEVMGNFEERGSFTSHSNQAKNDIPNINETDMKLKADMNELQSDIAQKDIEILMLKQQNWKMQGKLDDKILENNNIQNQLQSKDLETLDVLNVKNRRSCCLCKTAALQVRLMRILLKCSEAQPRSI